MKKIFEEPLYPYLRSVDQDENPPVQKPVIIIGAGPVGLTLAIDLALKDIQVVVLDDNEKVSFGSRAICFAKRPLEILDRLGVGEQCIEKGVTWSKGKVFFDERQVYDFDLLPDPDHKRPAFINLQQYYLETFLVQRLEKLKADGKPVEIRGKNKVTSIDQKDEFVILQIDTPEGAYAMQAQWVVACDGAASSVRSMLALEFQGRVFEDNFLIADVVMDAKFPTERWFWFDPPFNRGQSALLHKQPDNVWRIDLQLGWDIDKEAELKPEKVKARVQKMLGDDVKFDLEWVSIYTFQCRAMENFRHNRVIFAGDSAHQVSPFGARGANSGIADADNLAWKLKLVLDQLAPEELLDSYVEERVLAARENILNSTRSTDFITPKSKMSGIFRNAVLELAEQSEFARPLVNSGRLSVPSVYDKCSLTGKDHPDMPAITRPGAPAIDAPVDKKWLIDLVGNDFQLLAINTKVPDMLQVNEICIKSLIIEATDIVRQRYLGNAKSAVYLLRPDQHIMARWLEFDEQAVIQEIKRITRYSGRGN
ncbi:FAD-dependent oxidoreductase [Sneathiella glossodoripedis]|uniref:FAD-dependent oxidoreductase n=1 Tax=Sneathiella glossodoripedis TaxID=418853 RepID=UPI00046ED3ED|nr:FAD-dependent oxidoreductase [Sneathiella glossodoripedis]